jgi:hypothetical protein
VVEPEGEGAAGGADASVLIGPVEEALAQGLRAVPAVVADGGLFVGGDVVEPNGSERFARLKSF